MTRFLIKAALCAAFCFSATTWAASDPLNVRAQAYLLRIGNETVWAQQTEKRLPPASLTKMMTALLVAAGSGRHGGRKRGLSASVSADAGYRRAKNNLEKL